MAIVMVIMTPPQGLGIMIIEGSHKATGTGIFVSDIQERSAAFHVSLSLSLLSLLSLPIAESWLYDTPGLFLSSNIQMF